MTCYDLVGNRTSRTSSVSSLSPVQNLSVSANDWLTTHTYDNNGNTTDSSEGTDIYDWKNRLIRRTTDTGFVVNITYNAMGDRVRKVAGSMDVNYLVDRNNLTGYAQVVDELNGFGEVERVYVYGLDLIAQSQLMPVDNPDHWETTYYLYDGLGTVRGLADEAGLVTDAYFYDAYGVLLNVVGVTPNVYLFTGEQWDPDLGMYFLRARYLNPETGRFHTMDSFEGVRTDPQSLHKYLYAHANPVINVDPSGNYSLMQIGVASATIATLSGIVYTIALYALDTPLGDSYEDCNLFCEIWTIIASTSLGTGAFAGKVGCWLLLRRPPQATLCSAGVIAATFSGIDTLEEKINNCKKNARRNYEKIMMNEINLDRTSFFICFFLFIYGINLLATKKDNFRSLHHWVFLLFWSLLPVRAVVFLNVIPSGWGLVLCLLDLSVTVVLFRLIKFKFEF